MKKFIMGLIVGMMIMAGSSAFADSDIKSFVGNVIQGQFNVSIDGEQFDTPAIVVDGTSFLPARSFAEQLGYKVMFDTEGGIQLERSMEKTQAQIDAETENARLIEETHIRSETMRINSSLTLFKDALDHAKDGLQRQTEKLKAAGYTDREIEELGTLDSLRDKVAKFQAEVDRLQAELEELQ